jgi:hypothetical protein
MKRHAAPIIAAILLLLSGTSIACAQDELLKPTKEHDLLRKFAGEWQITKMMVPMPGDDPTLPCEGTESAKMVGGFWLVAQTEAKYADKPFQCSVTIGYDEKTKKYTGTYVDSKDSTLWQYVGEVDAKGKKLTAEGEGPSPHEPTKKAKFRVALELEGDDRKVYSSYYQDENGRWWPRMTVEYQRKP